MSAYRQKQKELEFNRYRGQMQVWQRYEDCYMPHLSDVKDLGWLEDFELVAVVDTFCLSEALMLTNKKTGWLASKPKMYREFRTFFFGFQLPQKKTGVGDVLVTPDGIPYLVESDGFTPLKS